jgi:hypothetical protein
VALHRRHRAAAQSAGCLKREIGRYLNPGLLIIDELGPLKESVDFVVFCLLRLRVHVPTGKPMLF